MLQPLMIDRLSFLARDYDALLCDAWGVIHNGVKLLDGAAQALEAFRRTRGPVIILTNAPRPHWIIPPQLDRLGLKRDAYDAVVTSGDATRAEIEKRSGRSAFRIGPAKDDGLFEGLDARFAPLERADYMICTGLNDDSQDAPEDYRALLAAAAARGLVMICANPDIVVRWGERMIYCAGALAEIHESLGGRVVYGGKPHPPIYDLALERIADIAGRQVAPGRVLAIGDGVMTDIKGANGQGIDAVLIAGDGGVHDGPLSSTGLATTLHKAGAHVVAVMERLQW